MEAEAPNEWEKKDEIILLFDTECCVDRKILNGYWQSRLREQNAAEQHCSEVQT